mgnify:CR=1 FL=1
MSLIYQLGGFIDEYHQGHILKVRGMFHVDIGLRVITLTLILIKML